jgi:hypothetical protein
MVATARTAAYILDHQWLPLPRNHPQVIEASAKAAKDSTTPVAELTLDGHYYVPVVSGRDVVIAYVGPLTSVSPEQEAEYPDLKASIELAPAKTVANGTRSASLYSIAPGFTGFGQTRVAATLEQVHLQVIADSVEVPAVILRCTAALPPGRYALRCPSAWFETGGENAYEFEVE